MKSRLMAHMVAGYPDAESSFAVAEGIAALGADYIEVQFPFSDPTADGPLIQEACELSLKGGFTLDAGFALIERITDELKLPVFLMSYAGPVVVCGVDRYLARLKDAGGRGVIIPDLPPGNDEGLYALASRRQLAAVPVVSPNITGERLGQIAALEPEYIYAALRAGITGADTHLDERVIAFLERLGSGGAKVFGGFGIRSRKQMDELSGHLHAAVVGSQLLRVLNGALERKEDIKTALTRAL